MRYSKKLIAGIVVLNVIFAIAVLWNHFHTGNEPTTLVGAWFAFTTVELWNLATIKKAEIKKERGEHDTDH